MKKNENKFLDDFSNKSKSKVSFEKIIEKVDMEKYKKVKKPIYKRPLFIASFSCFALAVSLSLIIPLSLNNLGQSMNTQGDEPTNMPPYPTESTTQEPYDPPTDSKNEIKFNGEEYQTNQGNIISFEKYDFTNTEFIVSGKLSLQYDLSNSVYKNYNDFLNNADHEFNNSSLYVSTNGKLCKFNDAKRTYNCESFNKCEEYTLTINISELSDNLYKPLYFEISNLLYNF